MATATETPANARNLIDDKFLRFDYLPEHHAILASAKKTYIPEEDFRESFNNIYQKLLEAPGVEKFIFDKRNLKTFNQASMTWYHVVWKEQVYARGVRKHVKLLPDDPVFRKSVDFGKMKIQRDHPDFDYDKYQIAYKESLDEALEA